MTLAEYLTALAQRIVTINTTIEELKLAGMTPEQIAALDAATAEVAALRASVDNLTAQTAGLQTQVNDVTGTINATAAVVATTQTELGALRSEFDALKGAVGDLGALPPLQ